MKLDGAATASNHKSSKNGQGHTKELNELPETYGENMVVLLPVSPDKVHAFWDTSTGEPKGHKDQDAGGRTVLRLHEPGIPPTESGHGSLSFEVSTAPGLKSKYINLKESGKSFLAEIGRETKEGRFVSSAQSNIAETPRPLPVQEKAVADQPIAEPAQHQPPRSAIIPQAHREPEPFKGQPRFAPSKEAMAGAEPFPRRILDHHRKTEGGGSGSTAESELLLTERRTAIFRHLSEAVPIPRAESELVSGQDHHQADQASQSGQSRPDGIKRERDLTEISERKFVAGISS